MSLVAATSVDYALQARGSNPSKTADIRCSGEIIGYRTVTTKILADKVNTEKAFPHDEPNGSYLGKGSVYFSNGFGDYDATGSGIHWCIAYADTTQLKAANKVWFTDDPKLRQCTRFEDPNVDAYIGMMSNQKFSPASTLRFAKLDTYLQVAIPFTMLDKMKFCGKCFPRTEAKTMKSQYPRVNWKEGPYVGSNVKQKRDDLDARAPAACALKAKPKTTPQPKPKTSKPKTSKPKGLMARTTF